MERGLRRLQVLNSPGRDGASSPGRTWPRASRSSLTGLPTPDVVNAGAAGLYAVTLPPQSGASLPATVANAGRVPPAR